MKALQRWRARHPAGERTLYVPGRRGPKMFVACRCERCGTPFTIWRPMEQAIRRLVSPTVSWPPARVSRFCSEECGSSATPRKARARVLVAGRCRRPACGIWFTAPVPATREGTLRGPMPTYCSPGCATADRKRGKKQRPHDTAARNRSSAARLAGSGRLCPACWQRPVSTGAFQQVLCPECMATVESSCRGKARRGTPRNAERIAAARSSWRGRDMSVYLCGLCNWWHVGGGVAGWRVKQVSFTVDVFVARAPAELVERIRLEYAPDRSNGKGPRVRVLR